MEISLLSLIKNDIKELENNDTYVSYEQKKNILKKLDAIVSDMSELDNLTDEDIRFLSAETKKKITFMKKYKSIGILDSDDLKSNISSIQEYIYSEIKRMSFGKL